MLEITLIILNVLLISILLGAIFVGYKFYKNYGKNLMGGFESFSKMNEQLRNQQNPLEQLNNIMKMMKKK